MNCATIVSEMVGARWRIRRLWLIEDGLFEDELQNGTPDSNLKPTASGDIRLSRVFNKLATGRLPPPGGGPPSSRTNPLSGGSSRMTFSILIRTGRLIRARRNTSRP